MNDLCHLLGGYSLKEAKPMLLNFWKKYRAAYPNFQLWEQVDDGHKDLSQCLPLFLHGDEGVSFKKGGIFVFSFQGAIGFGSSKRAKEMEQNLRALDEGIPLNFLKNALQTRILICACPKERGGFRFKIQFSDWKKGYTMVIEYIAWMGSQMLIHVGPGQELYSEDRRLWHAIFEFVTEDLAQAQRHGVQLGGGEVIYPIILGNKGDWSYLVPWSISVLAFLGFDTPAIQFQDCEPTLYINSIYSYRFKLVSSHVAQIYRHVL